MKFELVISGLFMAGLVACATPPKPAQVGNVRAQEINNPETRAAILDRERILAVNQATAARQDAAVKVTIPASEAVTVQFKYNSTAFQPTRQHKARLAAILTPYGRSIRRIEVRGRTSGNRPTAGNQAVALKRALAAQRYLIAQGVPADMIAVNYNAAADYVANNNSSTGKALNQRVDIEVFYK